MALSKTAKIEMATRTSNNVKPEGWPTDLRFAMHDLRCPHGGPETRCVAAPKTLFAISDSHARALLGGVKTSRGAAASRAESKSSIVNRKFATFIGLVAEPTW